MSGIKFSALSTVIRLYLVVVVNFFFSSRRRHTRWTGDWSSDVCSSDLIARQAGVKEKVTTRLPLLRGYLRGVDACCEIGRATCRERVYISVVDASLKK